jgi:hypothetical protein
LVCYCLTVSLQFTIYEYLMKMAKVKYGEDYDKHQFNVNLFASFMAGAIGSGVTNGLDVLTITM